MSLSLFTVETIEIAQYRWPHLKWVSAHRLGNFAVHRSNVDQLFDDDWRITHLPTGRCAASGFPNIESAADAAVEIERLRNDWSIMTREDFTPELRDKCAAICQAHGGTVGAGKDSLPKRPEYNGYAPERING
jgi:hypothetical protein